MSGEAILAISGAAIIFITFVVIVIKKLPKRLKQEKFVQSWLELQKNCKDKNTWPDAIIAADKLLDKALRLRRFKGNTTGERMVSAQDKFSNNDGVWFAHRLFKKIDTPDPVKLSEENAKKALAEFRRGLRDLGALPQKGDANQ